MDFKWEMQERIDRGMSPDQAYNATRDSYAAFYDNRDKFYSGKRDRVEEDEHGILHITSCDESCVCDCATLVDCECVTRRDSNV